MTSTIKRFLAAVHCCATEQSIKTRLSAAWLEHLDTLDASEIPEEIRSNFIGLRNAMYDRKPLNSESAPLASIRKMSTAEAAMHVSSIVTLYTELAGIGAAPVQNEKSAPSRKHSGRNGNTRPQLN
jgi:hypothetical protein